MLKNISLLIFMAIFSAPVLADCVEACVAAAGCSVPVSVSSDEVRTCRDIRFKCEGECGVEPPRIEHLEDDVYFTGTKLQSGNTTLMQGSVIPVDAAASGLLSPEDLAEFEKSVVYVKNGSEAYSRSEAKKQNNK